MSVIKLKKVYLKNVTVIKLDICQLKTYLDGVVTLQTYCCTLSVWNKIFQKTVKMFKFCNKYRPYRYKIFIVFEYNTVTRPLKLLRISRVTKDSSKPLRQIDVGSVNILFDRPTSLPMAGTSTTFINMSTVRLELEISGTWSPGRHKQKLIIS